MYCYVLITSVVLCILLGKANKIKINKNSEEESTEYEGGSSGDDYVERSFQVLFIDDADIPEVV